MHGVRRDSLVASPIYSYPPTCRLSSRGGVRLPIWRWSLSTARTRCRFAGDARSAARLSRSLADLQLSSDVQAEQSRRCTPSDLEMEPEYGAHALPIRGRCTECGATLS